MTPIDLNAVLPAGSPVSVTAQGSIGVLSIRQSFESAWANALRAAGLTPDTFSVEFDLFSTHYTARAVIRTTAGTVTPFQVAWIVEHTAPEHVDSVTVLSVGTPGDVVTVPHVTALDPITRFLANALGLDVPALGASVMAALQIAVVVVLVVGAFWIWHLSKVVA